MPPLPSLSTDRLDLRPFAPADAPEVTRLAGAIEVAQTTLNIPHPYERGMAEAWIARHQSEFDQRRALHWAIALREGGALVGAISLMDLQPAHARAELGYWIGHPYWGRGYCTEAAGAIVRYAFGVLNLHRIYACHFVENPASGRVMQKLGMSREGCLRQHVRKWDRFVDVVCYGLVRSED